MFFSNRSQTQPYRQLPLRIRQRRRLIEKTEHRDGFRQKTTYFHWNGNNQLESLTNAQGEVWYYKYDALGRRIEKACPERQSMTRYVWDGDQIAYQSTEKQGKLDSHRHSVFNGWELIAQQDGYFKHDLRTNEKTWTEETHYAVSQPNGQPLALFNPQGKRTWRKQPTSLWGLPLLNRWERKQSEPINPNLLFAGQYLDDESGLAYNRFRYYDPESGNYLTSDPIGLQGGEMPYGYVHNPLGFIDPFGWATCPTLTKDALGRITSAEARVTKDMIDTGTAVNKSARDYARSLGNQTDDAGHILAKILGGQGSKGNVFPQLKGINRGDYRVFEKQIRDLLKSGSGPLDLKWSFIYSGSGTRPIGIQYDVFKDGVKILDELFPN